MQQIEINHNVAVARRNRKHGHSAIIKDGKRGITKEYSAWQQMLNRVYTGHGKQEPQVNHGIFVYAPWQEDFKAFYEYIGPKPSDKHRLQRLDLSKGYVPGNLIWAERGTIHTLSRTGTLYDYDGRQYTLRSLSRIAGISPQAMNNRLKNGWAVKAAVETPIGEGKRGRPRKVIDSVQGEIIQQAVIPQSEWVAART